MKVDRYSVTIGMVKSTIKEMQVQNNCRMKDCKNLLKKLRAKRLKIYRRYNKKHNSKMNS